MPVAVLASSNFTDPEHERLIWLAAGGLVLLGVMLIVATVFWWRGTKGEHAALAPLEVMGDRSFSTLTHVEQTRRLDAVRLHLEGDVEPLSSEGGEEVDLDEALREFQPGFDDLRDEEAPAADDQVKESHIAVELVGAADEPAEPGEESEEPVEPVTAEVDDEIAQEEPESSSTDDESAPEIAVPDADAIDADEVVDEVIVGEAVGDDDEDESVRTGEPVDR